MQVVAQEYDPAIPLAKLRPHPQNPNVGADGVVADSLEATGWFGVIMVQRSTCYILAGHTRVRTARTAGADVVPGLWVDCDDGTALRILLVDNEAARQGVYDNVKLLAALQSVDSLTGTGFDDARLAQLLRGDVVGGPPRPTLADRFLIPPFDVLDARSGWWRERKAQWLIATGGHLAAAGVRTAKAINAPQAYDPAFYDQKDAASAAAGREIPTGEFVRSGAYQPLDKGLRSGGVSIFDPVLCELAYRWFSPPGGTVIDPFAGGPVRGVVATVLGRQYLGCDLAGEQVEANRAALAALAPVLGASGDGHREITVPVRQGDLTPVEAHGGYLAKRDDLYTLGASAGGKVRTCLAIVEAYTRHVGQPQGLVTAGSRQSPQVNIAATVAAHLGLPCRVHVPAGDLTPELEAAAAAGAVVVQHRPGHNSVIKARARQDAADRAWLEIPFGMESPLAVQQTARQVANLPPVISGRLVVPVGSGMSLAGILAGLEAQGRDDLPVLGVVVGANPGRVLDKYAKGWRHRVDLVDAGLDYHAHAPTTRLGDLELDPVYEAKCLPFLGAGDVLWVVGCRETARPAPAGAASWHTGDGIGWMGNLPPASADLVFTCPPYYDLERYSDHPADLSAQGEAEYEASIGAALNGAWRVLREDRWCVIVAGDARTTSGRLRDMRGAVIRAASRAGLAYTSGAVYVPPIGALRIMAGRAMETRRTLGRAHQDLLVFCKGDRGRAAAACGPVQVHMPPPGEGEDQ